MTLLFFDGFQDPILAPKPEWATSTAWETAQTGRDGVANGSARQRNSTGGTTRQLVLPTPAATCIAGIAYNGTLGFHCALSFHTDFATRQLWIGPGLSGFLEVRRTSVSGTLLGTSSGHTPINANEWHYIEAKVVLHATAGSCVVRLDGVTVLNLTGVATSSANGSVTHISLFQGTSSGNGALYDDMYVCDAIDATATQGYSNDDFLGDVRVAAVLPTAAGDSTGWTPSTGANWAAVDENPANTTDYVSSVATATGTRDLYTLADLTGTIVKIYGVRVGLYCTKTDSGIATLKPVIKENSTVTVQAAQALAVGSWNAIWGAILAVKPSNSTVWGVSDVNGLQAGQEIG